MYSEQVPAVEVEEKLVSQYGVTCLQTGWLLCETHVAQSSREGLLHSWRTFQAGECCLLNLGAGGRGGQQGNPPAVSFTRGRCESSTHHLIPSSCAAVAV